MYEVIDPSTGTVVCDGFLTKKTARRYCELRKQDEDRVLEYRMAPTGVGKVRF